MRSCTWLRALPTSHEGGAAPQTDAAAAEAVSSHAERTRPGEDGQSSRASGRRDQRIDWTTSSAMNRHQSARMNVESGVHTSSPAALAAFLGSSSTGKPQRSPGKSSCCYRTGQSRRRWVPSIWSRPQILPQGFRPVSSRSRKVSPPVVSILF